MGTGPSSRGDNPAFVSFVRRPERGWATLPHKGISWWGLVPLSPLSAQNWGWRQEVGPAGVWRRPLSLPEGVGMAESWGVGALLASGSRGWSSRGEEQRVPRHRTGPVGRSRAAPQALQGSPGGGWSLLQLLPGTLPRSCCSHWGKASPGGNRGRLVACLGWGAEVSVGGGFPKSG